MRPARWLVIVVCGALLACKSSKAKQLRDRMCECKDLDCVEAVQAEYRQWDALESFGKKSIDDAEAMKEMEACRAKLSQNTGALIVGKLIELKDAMCKCGEGDHACADKLQGRHQQLVQELATSKVPVKDLGHPAVVPSVLEEFGKCVQRARGPKPFTSKSWANE